MDPNHLCKDALYYLAKSISNSSTFKTSGVIWSLMDKWWPNSLPNLRPINSYSKVPLKGPTNIQIHHYWMNTTKWCLLVATCNVELLGQGSNNKKTSGRKWRWLTCWLWLEWKIWQARDAWHCPCTLAGTHLVRVGFEILPFFHAARKTLLAS